MAMGMSVLVGSVGEGSWGWGWVCWLVCWLAGWLV